LQTDTDMFSVFDFFWFRWSGFRCSVPCFCLHVLVSVSVSVVYCSKPLLFFFTNSTGINLSLLVTATALFDRPSASNCLIPLTDGAQLNIAPSYFNSPSSFTNIQIHLTSQLAIVLEKTILDHLLEHPTLWLFNRLNCDPSEFDFKRSWFRSLFFNRQLNCA
jgi:hypothetical protein